ncbi:hypothetical protein PCANC_07719 [Puccinia coronata f. sp. avenae]|uniref:Uncharacterized protein n=1 Tax=Puccinia coronata f. sp. avenae TaxID=200324 RepID=A0A2N5VRA2_9BASI|nr:hypothetical protein PCANC_07719 [Puccinia coronata f. sp. avenae]
MSKSIYQNRELPSEAKPRAFANTELRMITASMKHATPLDLDQARQSPDRLSLTRSNELAAKTSAQSL